MYDWSDLIKKKAVDSIRNRARFVKSSSGKEHKFKVKMLLFHDKKDLVCLCEVC